MTVLEFTIFCTHSGGIYLFLLVPGRRLSLSHPLLHHHVIDTEVLCYWFICHKRLLAGIQILYTSFNMNLFNISYCRIVHNMHVVIINTCKTIIPFSEIKFECFQIISSTLYVNNQLYTSSLYAPGCTVQSFITGHPREKTKSINFDINSQSLQQWACFTNYLVMTWCSLHVQ